MYHEPVDDKKGNFNNVTNLHRMGLYYMVIVGGW